MPLPIVTPSEDHIAMIGKNIADAFDETTNLMSNQLTLVVRLLANRETAISFWERQGTNGVAVLTVFQKFMVLLNDLAPEKVTAEIASAGSTLVPHEDGTVTVS